MNNTIGMKFAGCVISIDLVAVLVLVAISGTDAAALSLSNSGGGSWQSYKDITVKENSGSILTDYQVLVQLSGSNFPTSARSDGADVRVMDSNGNELSYWIERWGVGNGKVWVKVPNVGAGGTERTR